MRQYRLQKRQHPIFSPVAIISTLFLAGGLGIGIYVNGGRAFSPGELSAIDKDNEMIGGFSTHADFSDQCNACHTPFKGVEAVRCEKCHENVKQQWSTGSGLHSRFELAEGCADCHLEHRGGNYDLTAAALADFEHEVTDFSLVKHTLDYQNAPLACPTCHLNEGHSTIFVSACVDCHQAAEFEFMTIHLEAFGNECLACHDGHDTLANFTLEAHAEVFTLTGFHANTACESCHSGGHFEDIPTACESCHAEPEVHPGLFGTNCVACHTTEDWLLATLDDLPFDHALTTGFSLARHITDYDGLAFTCRSCHTDNPSLEFTNVQCVACHAPANPTFMDNHIALFGENCLSCHQGTGRLVNFDHNQVWLLDGRHATLECLACHVDQVFQGTPGECVACHAEPDLHSGLFGTDCPVCHTTQAWHPAQLKQHTFLLDHGKQGEIACTTCHTTTYTEYTCYNCHEHEPADTEHKHLEVGISQPKLPDCARCHPTGREDEAG